MPLHLPRNPGKRHTSSLQNGLSMLLTGPLPPPEENDPAAVAASIPKQVDITRPVPVYTVPLEAVRSGAFLGSAVQTGWKYFILGKDEEEKEDLRGVATLSKRGGKLVFASYEKRPAAERLLQAIHMAENLEEVTQADYLLSCLELPPLHFTGLWLQRKRADILIPVSGLGESLTKTKPALLRKLLRERLKEGRALSDPDE